MGHDLMGDIGEPLDGDLNTTVLGDDAPIDPDTFLARPGSEDDPDDDGNEVFGQPGKYAGRDRAEGHAAGEDQFTDESVVEVPGYGEVTLGELKEALASRDGVADLVERLDALESQRQQPVQQQPTSAVDGFMSAFLADPQSRQAFNNLVHSESMRRGIDPRTLSGGQTQGPPLAGNDPRLDAMQGVVQRLDAYVQQQQIAQKEAEFGQIDADLTAKFGKDVLTPSMREAINREAYRLFSGPGREDVFGPEHYRTVAEALLARRGYAPKAQGGQRQQPAQGRGGQPVRLVPGRSIRASVARQPEPSLRNMSEKRFRNWLARNLPGGGGR